MQLNPIAPVAYYPRRTLARWVPWVVADGMASAVVWILFWWTQHSGYPGLVAGSSFGAVWVVGVVACAWVGLFAVSGLYSPQMAVASRWVPRVLVTVALGSFFGSLFTFLGPWVSTRPDLQAMFAGYFGLQVLAILFERSALHAVTLRLGLGRNRALLVGSGARAQRLYHELQRTPVVLRPRFVGFLATNAAHDMKPTVLHQLGGIGDLGRVLAQRVVDEIIVATEQLSRAQLQELVALSQRRGLRLKLPPDLYKPSFGTYELLPVLNAPLVEVRQRQFQPWEAFSKRVFDVMASVVLLLLTLPLLLVVSVAVRLETRGPVIFRQQRVGRGGKHFTLFKLRTMFADAEKDGPKTTAENDPRVTRLGRWLRKMRIDELPQLWNVLRGDMSLVGPRPEQQFFVDQIVKVAPHYFEVLTVRPGITGWGQIKNGYCYNLPDMLRRLRYDRLYIRNRSIWLDLRILWYSVAIVVMGRGR